MAIIYLEKIKPGDDHWSVVNVAATKIEDQVPLQLLLGDYVTAAGLDCPLPERLEAMEEVMTRMTVAGFTVVKRSRKEKG